MNVENKWSDSIDASKVEVAVKTTEVEEVRCAMNQMKIGKASAPCAVAIEVFKVGFSPYRNFFICFNEKPLKMMKNAFYLILKALFILRIFKFLS